jgi:hypothetical protein
VKVRRITSADIALFAPALDWLLHSNNLSTPTTFQDEKLSIVVVVALERRYQAILDIATNVDIDSPLSGNSKILAARRQAATAPPIHICKTLYDKSGVRRTP